MGYLDSHYDQLTTFASTNFTTFTSETERDEFFTANTLLLTEGMPIDVNINGIVTSFIWTGVTAPSTYDSSKFRAATLGTSPSSVQIGRGGLQIASGGRTLNILDAHSQKYLNIAIKYGETGSNRPYYFSPVQFITVPFADVFDTVLVGTQEAMFAATDDLIAESFSIRPATTGKLRVIAYAGTTVNDPVIVDVEREIVAGDLGNIVTVLLEKDGKSDLVVEKNDNTLVVFSGIDFYGGVQVNPPFTGLTKPFIESRISFPSRKLIVDTDYLSTVILDSNTTITENGRSYGVDTSSNTVTLTVADSVVSIKVFDLLKEFDNNSCFVDMGGDNFELDKKEKEYEFLNDGSTVHWFEMGKKVK